MLAEMWDLYVDCSRSVVGHIYAMWRHICLGTYANNVDCMYASGHFHSIEFISGSYTDIVVSYLHMK